MIESSILFGLIAGVVLVQTNATQPSVQEISFTWDHNTFGVDNNDNEWNPNIGCILFGNAICDLHCFLSIEVYYFEINTKGFCDNNQTCHCNYVVDSIFYRNWKKKFDAYYVYKAITRSKPLYKQVKNLFRWPFHTAREMKKILHAEISPYQYSKLLIRDDSFASIFHDNDKVDKRVVGIYVSARLRKIFDSNRKNAFYTNYEQNFRKALENVRDEGTLYNIAFELRMLNNEKLERIWQEHLTTNNLKQPNIEISEPEDLLRILTYTITKQVIEQRDEMSTDPAIGEAVHSLWNLDWGTKRSFHY